MSPCIPDGHVGRLSHSPCSQGFDQIGIQYGLGVRPKVVTSSPRRRRTSVASRPTVPAPITAALRGRRPAGGAESRMPARCPSRPQSAAPGARPRHQPSGTLTRSTSKSSTTFLVEAAVAQVDATLEVRSSVVMSCTCRLGRRCSTQAVGRSRRQSRPAVAQ